MEWAPTDYEDGQWRKRFALFPTSTTDGRMVWLQSFYFRRNPAYDSFSEYGWLKNTEPSGEAPAPLPNIDNLPRLGGVVTN